MICLARCRARALLGPLGALTVTCTWAPDRSMQVRAGEMRGTKSLPAHYALDEARPELQEWRQECACGPVLAPCSTTWVLKLRAGTILGNCCGTTYSELGFEIADAGNGN